MAQNLTANRPNGKTGKPNKPRKDFPLYAHASGRWAKKVQGKTCFFGPWSDPQAALDKWLQQKDDLLAGRTPRPPSDGLRIKDLLNAYRTAKERQKDAGEIAERSYYDYCRTCDEIYAFFGGNRAVADLAADDFGQFRAHLAKRLGPVGLWNVIRRSRMVFTWAYNNGRIDRPIRYGDQFRRPSARVLRLHKAEKGPRVYQDPAVIRRLLRTAGVNLKAAIYLALNCGLGNTDIALLPRTAIDLEKGWLSYPRHKTGIDRRCPLWDETVKALQAVLARRKDPKDPANSGFVFINKFGDIYVRSTGTDGVGQEFRKLQDKVGDDHDFYSLRHTFESVAKAKTGDVEVIKLIMGHVADERDMANVYDHSHQMEQFQADLDARRRRIVDAVRAWLARDADKDEVHDEEVDQ